MNHDEEHLKEILTKESIKFRAFEQKTKSKVDKIINNNLKNGK
jgi:hypothetical protein